MNAEAAMPSVQPADVLVRQYEALRRPGEHGSGAACLGRALVMRQGMAAWISTRAPAFPHEGPPQGPPPAWARAAASHAPSTDAVPVGVLGQVAQLLAAMALGGLHTGISR